MASWLTEAGLKSRKGTARVERFATDPGGTYDAAALARVDAALAAATSEARSCLTSYPTEDLPTDEASTPEVLLEVIADAALYRLAGRHETVETEIFDRYTAAVDWLKLVARGVARLDLTAEPASDVKVPRVLFTKAREDQVIANGGLDEWKV